MSPRLWTLKSKRRLLAFVIFTGVIGSCFLLAAYGFLRSSYVQKRIIASIRQPLADLGVEVKFDDFEVDVFAGFNFVNLRLKIDTPPRAIVDVAIKQARLSYGFWALLRQKLELSSATFNGLDGSIALQLPASKKTETAEQLTLEALVKLIKNPSFRVSIPSVDISDIKLHLTLTQGGNITDVEIKETEISAQAFLNPDQLKFKIKASVVASGKHSISTPAEAPEQRPSTTTLAFKKFSLQPDLLLDLNTTDDRFDLDFQLDKSNLELEGLSLSSESGVNTDKLDLNTKKLSSEQRIKLARTGSVNSADGWATLLPGLTSEGDLAISGAGLSFEQSQIIDKKISSLTSALDQLKINKTWTLELDKNGESNRHNWSFDQTAELRNVNASLADATKLALQTVTLKTNSKVKLGVGNLDYLIGLDKVQHPLFTNAVSFEQTGTTKLNAEKQSIELNMLTKLNSKKILNLALITNDLDSKLKAQLKLSTMTPQALVDVIPSSKGLAKLGWPEANGTVDLSIDHPEPWSRFKAENWHQLDSILKGEFSVKPSAPNMSPDQISFQSVKLATDMSLAKRGPQEKTNKLVSKLNLHIDAASHPSLASVISIKSQNDFSADIGKDSRGKIKHSTTANGEILLDMNANWSDKPGVFSLDHSMIATAKQKLIKTLRSPGPLVAIGDLSLKGDHKIEVKHRENSIMSVNATSLKNLTASANLTETIDQKPEETGKTIYLVKKPLRVQSNASLNLGSFDLKATIDGASLAYGKLATVSGMRGDVGATIDNIREPGKANVSASFNVKEIEFLEPNKTTANFDRSLRDLNLTAKAALNEDALAISTVEGGLKDGTIRFNGQGEFKTSGSGQLDGQISSSLIDNNAVIAGSGQFRSPFKFILFDRERLSFEATPSFENFNIAVGDFAAKNVNGTITVLEELKLEKDGKIGFLYLKSQNPFARVDYENVEPYVEEKSQLTFDQLSWKHIVLGPMVQSFEIRQNLVLLNDLKMDLLDGSMVGRFYLDLHPSRLRTGFLGRFSGLKPELLKAPDRRSQPKDWASLAGRMAVDFDMRKRLAAGRMDFTQIGKRQLLSLLDAMDPDFKDTQIAVARSGLRIAYPRAVGINMDHGLMDLRIDLDGAISNNVAVRSLPLSALINSQAGEALTTIETMIN